MTKKEKLRTQRAVAVVNALKEVYPHSLCSLNYDIDYELLFAVVMSAQCTDAKVNQVTPELYGTYPSLEALASASIPDVENIIRSIGLYRSKAKYIVHASRMLVDQYNSTVPNTMEALLSLPGVGRKTANLILGDVYHVPGVVIADTHCMRITGLLGLTDGSKNADSVEKQLRPILPPEESNDFCHRLVLHGRAVCVSGRPNCEQCVLAIHCAHVMGA